MIRIRNLVALGGTLSGAKERSFGESPCNPKFHESIFTHHLARGWHALVGKVLMIHMWLGAVSDHLMKTSVDTSAASVHLNYVVMNHVVRSARV